MFQKQGQSALAAFLNYDRVAGEVEARDVAERMDYTAEEREALRPDIDRKDVLLPSKQKTTTDEGSGVKFSKNIAGVVDLSLDE